MKISRKIAAVAAILAAQFTMNGQVDDRNLQQLRYKDFRGINQFEALNSPEKFEGFKVRQGGAFAIQMQGLSHSTGTTADTLTSLVNDFNLPTANLDIDVDLADGLRMHTRTYLSSRHHSESWVKGGYVQVTNLNWIKDGFMEDIMDIAAAKIGLMELNYGDYHFRRSDNAQALYNPFVGNLIMDAFTTEAGAEVYLTPGDFIFMAGMSNGQLNQTVAASNTPAYLFKAGWDKQMNDDLRIRLTGSYYGSKNGGTNYLYFGDRAGSRYYLVMEPQGSNPVNQSRSGRWNPNFINEVSTFMVNPFVKYQGLEFFGAFEQAKGKLASEQELRTYTQLYGELVYRFGPNEQVYVGGRYNTVTGQQPFQTANVGIHRYALAAGWFMSPNVLMKVEYVNQWYTDFDATSLFYEGNFKGGLIEAVVSF